MALDSAGVPSIADRLRRLCEAEAARAERHLFRELNPDRLHSPQLSSPPKRFRPASVLIPIIEREGRHTVLLTVRSPTMPSHAGEISFPGGGQRQEESVIETALREAEEEVGLTPDAVDVVGTFAIHYGGLGYAVTPVVGLVTAPPPIIPCPREVDEAFEVPLDHFIDPSSHQVTERQFKDVVYRMYAAPYEGAGPRRNVWGLTAGILHTFMRAWHDRPIGS
ncbi:hypothetical protein PB2503_13009 [Parvularcula bermudensis HTCC2503]|uniref:Nudix hydrolase domain-containing protein n=1 Tax=Parvularcula bermudensis (strain ATCC BAA-594 / HTCC2503 / KCTC 12087) TaxID=314260 RepID=E0TG68_PARBH|nr:CoA pyrophosphatase [Parvularcula bermudensis]ADM10639.1 hypothetical protein PB2503_13009 [Parvularcula bermudensis HTCC2503]